MILAVGRTLRTLASNSAWAGGGEGFLRDMLGAAVVVAGGAGAAAAAEGREGRGGNGKMSGVFPTGTHGRCIIGQSIKIKYT